MASNTLKMNLDQLRDKNPQRRRPPPIEINRLLSDRDADQSRLTISQRNFQTMIPQMIFPYHIDEENEVIYKMANNGTWTMKPRKEKDGAQPAGKLVRWAEVPQTLEFNYDWVLTKIAAQTRSVSTEPL